jgi:nucleotide-binding universal stress UspA family protein
MIRRILVATDGSDLARKAVAYGVDFAATLNAELIALTVIDLPSFIGRQFVPGEASPTHIIEPLEDYLKQVAESLMNEVAVLCAKRAVTFKKVVRSGNPVEEIVNGAEEEKADVVILGSHGRTAIGSVLLGSVTLGVIHRDSKIPVLIVRS